MSQLETEPNSQDREAWLRKQIERFSEERSIYKRYAASLNELLTDAVSTRAPLAIVQARAKTVSSFAEKTARKHDKYKDPLTDCTDLCGARVITQVPSEVDRICDYIRATFKIDEANSEDVRGRLKDDQFGYRSVHYIVFLEPAKLPGLENMVDERSGLRRAEIQVRTLLQHVWADVGHDRLYKSSFNVPTLWKREAARLAALLESADEGFSRLVQTSESFKMHYGVCLDAPSMERESSMLSTIFNTERDDANKPGLAIRLVQIWKPQGLWQRIIDLLDPMKDVSGRFAPVIRLELGNAICESSPIRSKEFSTGLKYLEEVAKPDMAASVSAPGDIEGESWRTRAMFVLACSYLKATRRHEEALTLLHSALERDPDNPYVLSRLLEVELRFHRHSKFLSIMRPALVSAIKTCQDHAAAKIEIPWAYMAIGRFHLLLGQRSESLGAYAKAIELSMTTTAWAPDFIFESERDFVYDIQSEHLDDATFKCVDRLLAIAGHLKFRTALPDTPVEYGPAAEPIAGPVLIVSGGTQSSEEAAIEAYYHTMLRALEGFRGTVICGGTTAGISGVLGRVAESLRQANKKTFELVGYLPSTMPNHAVRDSRYDRFCDTGGSDFTELEPLCYWTDILRAKIQPADVHLLGFNGGRISGFEYRLALALGARTGIAQGSGRAADELFVDYDWNECQNLVPLINDSMTLRGFFDPGIWLYGDERLDRAAGVVHEHFLHERRHENKDDPAMKEWQELREDFKESNRSQIRRAAVLLNACGFEIRESTTPDPFDFSETETEILAEMEHGRWNAERFGAGWRYSNVRDSVAKTSPYLIAWDQLTDEVKEWDRIAVRKWPLILHKAGLEIYRP